MEAPANIIERIFQNRILTHVLLWGSTLVIFPIYGMGFNMPFLVGLIIKFFFLPVQILATYYLIYYQIPKFIYQRKYWKFILSFSLSLLAFCTLGHLMNDFFIAPQLSSYGHTPHTFGQILINPFANVWYNVEDIYLTVFIVTGLKFIKNRIAEKTEMDILEQEKAKAEINLLKAQINPRILSKTLHQLYTLTKEKSDVAPEVVIKLSEILDYMLYQCNAPKVLLNNEIDLVQNYLDLEKLRYGAALKINFYHSLAHKFAEITPLLLLSLVESAFLKKEEKLPDSASVEIILKEEKDKLHLQIFSNLVKEEKMLETNFKKQLALLYPNQYQLSSVIKEEVYTLELTLNLITL